MGKGKNIGLVILLVAAIAIGAYLILRKPKANVVPNPNNNPNTNPNNNGSGNTTPPVVPGVPSIKDYVGKYMIAPYDGIKVYYNYDLTEAKTFNKGETIGWLGAQETGNWICPNRPGFYKVNDSGVTANCDIIISDANVKAIFAIK